MGTLASARADGRIPGRWVMVPKADPRAPQRRRNRVVRRRRQTFQRLLLAAGVTLLLGLFVHTVLVANLIADVALAGYVMQLRHWRAREVQRARVVRSMPREIVLDPPPHEIILDPPHEIVLEDAAALG